MTHTKLTAPKSTSDKALRKQLATKLLARVHPLLEG